MHPDTADDCNAMINSRMRRQFSFFSHSWVTVLEAPRVLSSAWRPGVGGHYRTLSTRSIKGRKIEVMEFLWSEGEGDDLRRSGDDHNEGACVEKTSSETSTGQFLLKGIFFNFWSQLLIFFFFWKSIEHDTFFLRMHSCVRLWETESP